MERDVYFAYGSNMLMSQMKKRCPESEAAGIARLADHRLAFTRYSERRASSVADIVAADGRELWGALYLVTERDLALLDVSEGHPKAYRRERIDVVDVDRALRSVWTYRVVKKEPESPPAASYWRLLVDGAREHGLPSEYLARLVALDHAIDANG